MGCSSCLFKDFAGDKFHFHIYCRILFNLAPSVTHYQPANILILALSEFHYDKARNLAVQCHRPPNLLLYHFKQFGWGCDMGQGGEISGASQWLCDIGWLKISAEFNIQPSPSYSLKSLIFWFGHLWV